MTSLLRQLVAGPRARHAEAKLDLCYVTDDIIVTSGPAITYPSRAYRNPLPRLLAFISSRHAEEWCVFEFRAEGTGYSDDAVQGRIKHFPWPDHHPPPFGIMPKVVESMREWLEDDEGSGNASREIESMRRAEKGSKKVENGDEKQDVGNKHEDGEKKKRVAILHCKAGKGRSGTVACSYLISMRGWEVEDALKRFTERRMRPGWGTGISIKSQRRWIDYVARWAKDKKYTEKKVEIVEVRVWGMRDGVSIHIRGFVEEGRKIKVLHSWGETEGEKINDVITDSDKGGSNASLGPGSDSGMSTPKSEVDHLGLNSGTSTPRSTTSLTTSTSTLVSNPTPHTLTILTPKEPLILPSQDINFEVERRNRGTYGFPSVATSTAHCWINTFFEGGGPERDGVPEREGTFEIDWDAMDGLKGSSRRGVRAVERVSVAWRMVGTNDPVKPAEGDEDVVVLGNDEDMGSASNVVVAEPEGESDMEELEGVKSYGITESKA